MSLIVGQLDRQIIVQQVTLTANSYGEPVESWANYATVWARVNQLGSTERFRSDAVLKARVSRFLIRYLEGLTHEMRISYDSQVWQIIGINVIGRNEAIEISAEVLK